MHYIDCFSNHLRFYNARHLLRGPTFKKFIFIYLLQNRDHNGPREDPRGTPMNTFQRARLRNAIPFDTMKSFKYKLRQFFEKTIAETQQKIAPPRLRRTYRERARLRVGRAFTERIANLGCCAGWTRVLDSGFTPDIYMYRNRNGFVLRMVENKAQKKGKDNKDYDLFG